MILMMAMLPVVKKQVKNISILLTRPYNGSRQVTKDSFDADLKAGSDTYDYGRGALPGGVYYVRLQNGSAQQVKAMIKAR